MKGSDQEFMAKHVKVPMQNANKQINNNKKIVAKLIVEMLFLNFIAH